ISKSALRPFGLLIVATLLGVAAVLILFRVGPSSVEGRCYDAVVFAGVYAVWIALLATVIRFWYLWQVARTFLFRLWWLPIRYAFNRIPGLFSWTPVWRAGGIKRSMLLPSRSLEYLRCLSGDSDQPNLDFIVPKTKPGNDSNNVKTGENYLDNVEQKLDD